jgi:diguanylate cyclase (GGDEF)-like protein
MVQDLAGALERMQEEGTRNSLLNELGSSIDLEEVLARTLEAGGAVMGADAALVSIHTDDKPIVATRGLSDEEAQRQAISGPPNGHEARAISIAYQYPASLEGEQLVHSGLAVPVPGETGSIGFIAIYSRSPTFRFEEGMIRELEELSRRAGPAIENARRFREARQLADLDSLTGLHNRRYFYETLGREVDRAQRYQRRLSLVIVDVDGFKEINDRIGHLAGDAVLAEIADRIRQVVRSADIPCRVGGDEFAVIVPEVEVGQARQLVGRIQRAVSAQPIARAGRVRVSAGVADIQPNDSPTSLFERGDESLYAAKHAGKGGLAAAD